jgi:hypothetical protein
MTTTDEKFRWLCEEEYARQLLLAETRLARAIADRDDLKMRQARFLEMVKDESD